jgi:hypothetical protein
MYTYISSPTVRSHHLLSENKKKPAVSAGFAIGSPRTYPFVFIMLAVMKVKRPNKILGSSLRNRYAIVPVPLKVMIQNINYHSIV